MVPEQTTRNTKRLMRRRGFTLLEGLVASVILVILVIGVAGALSSSYQQGDAIAASSSAVTLARQLMDEVVAKPFVSSDALGNGSGARSTYTNISAFNEYSDSSNALPLLEGGTLDVTSSQNFSRGVKVSVGAQPSIDTTTPASNFGIVTVLVTGPDGEEISVPEFVAEYAIPRQ
jgi:prepilin-type N-terminal cleavage/methylation domain-containing protein